MMKTLIFSIGIIFLSTFGLKAQTPTNSKNYVLETTVRVPLKTSITQLNGLAVDDANRTIQYLDGLGRLSQSIQWQGSPSKKDIVQLTEYDIYGRETKKYLPYAEETSNDGSFKQDAVLNHGKYYSPTPSISWDPYVVKTNFPYSVSKFEQSPLDRVLEQGNPGAVWQPSTARLATEGRTVITENEFNSASEVLLWTVNVNGASAGTNFYDADKLYKTITKDENWTSGFAGTTEEFKDVDDRVILKKSWKDNTTALSTYYVYDDFGNLRYVIPPAVIATSFAETDAVFENYIYAYRYDGRKRNTERKVPGKGWEFMIYNQLDQLIMSQDAKQRTKTPQEWQFTKYDAFGRTVLTGIYTYPNSTGDNSVLSPSRTLNTDLQNIVNVQTAQLWEDRDNASLTGYTNYAVPTGNIQTILTKNFYDDYSFASVYAYTTNGSITQSTKTRGLLTGKEVRVLGTNVMLATTNYYDEDGRVLQSKSANYLGGTDLINNVYDFLGNLTSTQREHIYASTTTKIVKSFSYDHAGRKREIGSNINNQTYPTILSKSDYNEIGQLRSKNFHSVNGSLAVQQIDYSYNERGWLSKINDPEVVSSNKVFGMDLSYANKADAFNGNIGAISWQTMVPPIYTTLFQAKQSYVYNYDALNRLEKAQYTTAGKLNYFNEELTYDAMGNIETLSRTANGSALNSFTYNYISSGQRGNKLYDITDAISSANNNTYTYDINGNQTSNAKLGITGIDYNMLNLPQSLTKTSTGEVLNYTYDAEGNKLRKQVVSQVTEYVSGIQYNGSTIEFIITEEGRALPGSPYTYEYYLKDHLGDTRATIKQDGSIVQIRDYYAFGLEMDPGNSLTPSLVNNYTYNGKEKQTELGLNQLDYGARFYDPVVARFNAIDPHTGIYNNWSGYLYAGNDPIRYEDKNGQGPGDVVAGYIAGFADNILGTQLRERYTPTSSKDYNTALRSADQISLAAGAVLMVDGTISMASGAAGLLGTGGLALTGVGTPVAAVTGTASGVLLAKGALEVVGGGILMANAARNLKNGSGTSGNSPETTKSRSKPKQEGTPNSSEIQSKDKNGLTNKYTTWDPDGKITKEYRGTGKDHGNISRPNVKEPKYNIDPKTGKKFQNGYEVRKPKPEEIPKKS